MHLSVLLRLQCDSACIISVIRLCYLGSVTTTDDPSWDNTELTLWSVAELNAGILCASLQTLRPLLVRCVPSMASGYNNNHNICRVLDMDHDGGGEVFISFDPEKSLSRDANCQLQHAPAATPFPSPRRYECP